MGKYDQYKESAFTHEVMQPMKVETDMDDEDDLTIAYLLGYDDAKSDYSGDIKELRAALAVIYRAHEKVLDEGDAWFITDDTTVGAYICSIFGAPPEEGE